MAGPGPLVPPPLGPRPRSMTPAPIRRPNPAAGPAARPPMTPPAKQPNAQKDALPPIGTGFAPGSEVTIHKKQVKLTHPDGDKSNVLFETIETDEKRHS